MPRAGSPERAPTRAASAAADDRGWSSSWWVGKGRSGCSRSTFCFYTLRTGDGRALRSRLKRSEEHTSELQSLMRISYAVFCLKKKKKYKSLTILPLISKQLYI